MLRNSERTLRNTKFRTKKLRSREETSEQAAKNMSCIRTKYLGLFSHHFSWNSSGKYPLKPLSHSIFDRTEKCGSPLLKHSEVTRCSEPSKQTQKSVKRVFLPEFTAEKLSHTFNRARRPKFPRNFEKSGRKMLSHTFPH